jgi:hypothetical protein
MTLRLRHGDVDLAIGVRGYQFPFSLTADREWLDVAVALRVGDRTFEHVDPALETTGLARLALWLRQAAELAPAFEAWAAGGWNSGPTRLRSRLGFFTEPCLTFEVRSAQPVALRVRLRHELRPTFLDGWLEFPLGRAGLLAAAEEVEALAATYPPKRGTL